ncbi:MAG: hypothetical protein KC620_15165, partial [Myxococcales bacterium]|nr:hypothetical protein [Myxococcales bacterium]
MKTLWRHVFYVGALIFSLTLVGLEIGASLIDLPDPDPAVLTQSIVEQDIEDMDAATLLAHREAHPAPPGMGIPALAFVDGWWLLNIVFFGLPFLIGFNVFTKAQAIITLLAGLGLLITSIFTIFKTLALLLVMISLLLAVPFGTL